jgi:hypothetical protein
MIDIDCSEGIYRPEFRLKSAKAAGKMIQVKKKKITVNQQREQVTTPS